MGGCKIIDAPLGIFPCTLAAGILTALVGTAPPGLGMVLLPTGKVGYGFRYSERGGDVGLEIEGEGSVAIGGTSPGGGCCEGS